MQDQRKAGACSPIELMIVCAAHALEDGKTVAVGTGVPCAAAMLAQKTHAPNLVVFFEAGGVAPLLPTMPISVGDSRTIHKAIMATSMADVMQFCQKGMMDYTFLSGAQIDPYGNLNSTMIGSDYARPKVRLPGSGGANDLASFCWRTLIIMRHDAKKFVEKLDFLTSPGYLTGPGAREAAGLPRDTGPQRVITELAVLGFHPESKRMMVSSLHPGKSLEQVQAATGFRLEVAASIGTTREPTAEELRILREEVDPLGYVLRRGG
jgi:glutaconate CoA-transferase, subunit B